MDDSGKGTLPKVPYEDSVDYLIQANNPIAEVTTFSFENFYLADIQGLSDDADQFLLRYGQPLSFAGHDWLFRATLPINHFPEVGGGHETGLGDLSAGLTYLFDTSNPNVSFGVGPVMRFPTATHGAILGNEKWSAGLCASYFNGSDEKLQFGFDLGWLQSFAGDSGRNYFNVGSFRPFVFYQLGGGWYTGTSVNWVYNFQNDDYNMPIGLRLGKVFEGDNKIVNLFVEPQISMANSGVMPEWQLYSGVRLQFW